MLGKSRADKRIAKEPQIIVTNNEEAFMPDDKSLSESGSTWGVVNLEGAESASAFDELRMPSSKLPWAICTLSGVNSNMNKLIGLASIRKRRLDHQLHSAIS